MKHIKSITAIVLFLMVTMVSAQTKSVWPELKNVESVASRMTLNIENKNTNAAFSFTETLVQATQKLAASTPSGGYKDQVNKKITTVLLEKAQELHKKSLEKASEETLKTTFAQFTMLLKNLNPENKK